MSDGPASESTTGSPGRPQAPWRVTDTFLVRRAGFPFALLDAFAAPRTAEAARRCAAALRHADELREALLREEFPAAVARARADGDRAALRALSKLRGRVGARTAVPTPPA
ncbi:hypothetical protein, partial [Streptomyces sp. I05A-00742]|uniref:hypothetical protein n=1 Tax=Streptomyces sp. I05A-00742 TaxID=2732853 RepID=UPI001BB0E2DD